ncbi:MAG TPA: helix-turn-helix transcriptional regulator [Prosthecobacter sp.]
MISAADLQTLSDAALALYSPDLRLASFPGDAFRFLAKLTGVEQINYANLDPRAGTMDMATSCLTPDWAAGVEGFGRCMWKYPMTNFDPTVNDGKPFFSTDFVSARQFRDLDIYSECFRLLGMDHHGAVHVPTEDGKILWFGLERQGTVQFNERDRLMLTLAQPHPANALRLAIARQKVRDEVAMGPEIYLQAGYTPRESEVAFWLTEGKSNVEMAVLMKLHVQTVKSHINNLFNKTGCGNRLALTLHLIEQARSLCARSTGVLTVQAQRTRPGRREKPEI